MPNTAVYGYTDKLSYKPGETLQVMVDPRVDNTTVAAELVRLRRSDGQPDPEPITWAGSGTHVAQAQRHCVGSFAAVANPFADIELDTFTWGAWFHPTLTTTGQPQGILGAGDTLQITHDGKSVTFDLADQSGHKYQVRAELDLQDRAWYFLSASIHGQRARLLIQPLDRQLGEPTEASGDAPAYIHVPNEQWMAIAAAGTVTVTESPGGARGRAEKPFNGKVEAPFLIAGALTPGEEARCGAGDTTTVRQHPHVVAAWAFNPLPGLSTRVEDLVGNHHGITVNLPQAGVTGVSWDGTRLDFTTAPDQYATLHFHDDDLLDVGWQPLTQVDLPADLESGIYGIRLKAGQSQDIVPFTVLPAGPTASKVLVVMSTFTYLAYGNEHMYEGDATSLSNRDIVLDERDQARTGRPEFGLSLYDVHTDGSGVVTSSARRPIINMRADYEMWLMEGGRAIAGDLYLVEWLTKKQIAFDTITDLELHEHGETILSDYSVVITGSHPEYFSGQMLDAFENYRDTGGNLMYLGGNGLYQVTAVHSVDPLVIEIRRGNAGVRIWESPPGECYLAATGEPGGLWRYRGRPPQKLVGVGFCAQGWDTASPYQRTDASYDGAVAWIFDGVETCKIGTAGRLLNGAAGDELDRVDYSLGTPRNAHLLAASSGHSDYYQRSIEEIGMNVAGAGGGATDPEVHADMVYFEVPGGGSVFSVGSIAWTGSMLTEAEDPSPSRITENVVRRMAGLD
ncbi:large subunit of N,N-dimethylformamidase [Dactylosporangium fulvum]|uniref:LamG domain-containing protein n=1 Tax=Dactylosporangium fulvum TaxID=53359 RepID=A0ABY5WAD8_9ACTN|nr:LamG domain-containing protein [Dactylosporangium fulvum]UWP85663.1 LamG domain-containing protein [Dactylosporangium fulvum]